MTSSSSLQKRKRSYDSLLFEPTTSSQQNTLYPMRRSKTLRSELVILESSEVFVASTLDRPNLIPPTDCDCCCEEGSILRYPFGNVPTNEEKIADHIQYRMRMLNAE